MENVIIAPIAYKHNSFPNVHLYFPLINNFSDYKIITRNAKYNIKVVQLCELTILTKYYFLNSTCNMGPESHSREEENQGDKEH